MKKNVTLWIMTGLLIAAVIGILYTNYKVEKIVVIDVIKVCNEFKLKKELEKTVEVKMEELASTNDSLKALLEMARQKNDKDRYDKVAEELYVLQNAAEEAVNISNRNINEQVWKRLNPLIDEYGKLNGFRLVIGANGMGTVLYNIDAIDKTNEVIKFINESYEKGSR